MVGPNEQPLPIDVSLLAGLEAGMTSEEQKDITSLMTSGDPEKLGKAAAFLTYVGVLVKLGVGPHSRSVEHNDAFREINETSYTNEVAVRKAMLEGHNSLVTRIRLQEAEINANKRLHPLPSRMPRFFTLDTFDPDGSPKDGIAGIIGLPKIDIGLIKAPIGTGPLGRNLQPSLVIVDDEYDGTVSDAFAEIKVCSKGTVKVTKVDNEGIRHILGGNDQIVDKPTSRVVIIETHNDASQKGLRKGDIITHVNGKAISGTSADLAKMFKAIKEDGEQLNIVVNAEPSVAEALRLRSIC